MSASLTQLGVASDTTGAASISLTGVNVSAGQVIYVLVWESGSLGGASVIDSNLQTYSAGVTANLHNGAAGMLNSFYLDYATPQSNLTIFYNKALSADNALMIVLSVTGSTGTYDSNYSSENGDSGFVGTATTVTANSTALQAGELNIGTVCWTGTGTLALPGGWTSPPNLTSLANAVAGLQINIAGGTKINAGTTAQLSPVRYLWPVFGERLLMLSRSPALILILPGVSSARF